jgi:hypothetical protein
MPTHERYTRDARGDQVNAYYVLCGAFDPDEITRDRPPDGQADGYRSMGTATDRRVADRARGSCRCSPVLAALHPAFERFCELGQRYEATIQCVVYAYGAELGQHFEREHVRQSALLNASIDLGLYALGDADE